MKKNGLKRICLTIGLFASSFSYSQVQQQVWYLKNNEIDFRTTTPVVSPISSSYGINSGSTSNEGHIGVAIHNASGEKILTTFDSQIYNKFGSVIGDLEHWTYGTSSPIIIPNSNSSCKYYIVYTVNDPILTTNTLCGDMGRFSTFYAEVDLEANGGLGQMISTGNNIQVCDNKFLSSPVAVSKSQANGDRYLYILDLIDGFTNQLVVKKYLVSSTGINFINNVYSGTENVMPSELELSHDGSKLALANSSGNNVKIIHLDAVTGNLLSSTGNNGNGTSGYIIPSSTSLTGVEFSSNGDYLFVGSKSVGIFRINIPANSVGSLSISPSQYGNSDLESAYDPNGDYKIYAIHDNGTNLGAINQPNSLSPIFTSSAISNVSTFDQSFATTQSAFNGYKYLPKTIDGEDYTARFSNPTSACCVATSGFDVYSFSAQTNTTWTPTSNPFNNQTIVTVEHELRIPAGKTIIIKDMTFKFAPGAKVIIERSPTSTTGVGGKLTLDNSTFTVDNNCGLDMWSGIQVYGHPSVAQTSTNTKQGSLYLINNSIIEHAYIGAMAGFKNSGSIDAQYNGGIISSINSKFYNNQVGVLINGASSNWIQSNNNKSKFTNTTFEWNGTLLKPTLSYDAQVKITSTKGINFIGSDFINNSASTDINNYLKGIGLIAYNSTFGVVPRCLNMGCTSIDRTYFKNLLCGVFVTNWNLNTFNIDRSNFENCRVGTFANGAQNERITRNNFFINESSSYQTAGLVLHRSTGYFVTENLFRNINDITPVLGAKDYGIVVINSGESHNEIYLNTFRNLNIGGQSEGINGTSIANSNNTLTTGLQWKCNQFNSSILEADLTVLNGRIDYQQGYTDPTSSVLALSKAAKNKFSLNGEDISLEHDIKINAASQYINYVHLADANQTPDSYTLSRVTPQLSTALGFPVLMTSNGCPTKITGVIIIDHKKEIAKLQQQIQILGDKIDGGNTNLLLNTITESTNNATLTQELLDKSPYLSDKVIEEYIKKNPSTGQVKQVLIANSKLSAEITKIVETIQLPNGVRNQINSAQNNISKRDELLAEIKYLEDLISKETNELLYSLQMDELTNDAYILELESNTKLEHRKNLLDMYIQQGNSQKEANLRTELASKGVSQEYLNIMQIQKELTVASSELIALQENPNLLSEIENLSFNAEDILVKGKAIDMLTIINQERKIDPFLEFGKSSTQKNLNITEESHQISEAVEIPVYVSIYPNPAIGKVNLDFQNMPDGKIEIKFIDLLGKVAYENTYENSNGELIDISEFHKGLYVVKIMIDNQIVEVQKLEVK